MQELEVAPERLIIELTETAAITVAEFVEDAATLDMVKNRGIDLAQGYYFEHPEVKITGKKS